MHLLRCAARAEDEDSTAALTTFCESRSISAASLYLRLRSSHGRLHAVGRCGLLNRLTSLANEPRRDARRLTSSRSVKLFQGVRNGWSIS